MVCDCRASGKDAAQVLGTLHLLDLVEARLGLRGAGAGGDHLIVDVGELLVGYRLAVRTDEVVADFKSLDLVFGLAHAVLELFQAGIAASAKPAGPHWS